MIINITDLSAGYGMKPVLKDINVQVKQGHICALLGHNGSGKTTLINCINALHRPTGGQVTVLGKEVSKLDRVQMAKLVSIVPQSSYSVFSFSVLDMILMGSATRLKTWGSPGKQEIKKAYEVMEEVEISRLAKSIYTELSGGQQQMVLLARAIFQDTPLMLLDEPNSHLDFCNQHRIMDLMRKMVRMKGITALITLHDPNLALYYCDEVIMLNNGRVIAKGSSEMVMTSANLRQAIGENISMTGTIEGLQVVIPRSISNCDSNNNMEIKGGIKSAM